MFARSRAEAVLFDRLGSHVYKQRRARLAARFRVHLEGAARVVQHAARRRARRRAANDVDPIMLVAVGAERKL